MRACTLQQDKSLTPVVSVTRGDVLESVHYGVGVVVDVRGDVVFEIGDSSFVTYPRSALKPIQALHLVETGAYDALELTPKHLAIACASHMGEDFHAEIVSSWLARLSLGENHLACGAAYPLDVDSAHKAIRKGAPSRIWHNCSGKHCGFLAVAKHSHVDVDGYEQFTHPTQARYRETLSEFIGRDAETLAWGRDDCTLPAPAMSMLDMARAMARFASSDIHAPARLRAVAQVHAAMRGYPAYVDGTDGLTPRVVELTNGEVIVKVGAEGYVAAFLPKSGFGLALKIGDGNARARAVFLMRVLVQIGALSHASSAGLDAYTHEVRHDSVGGVVGHIRAD